MLSVLPRATPTSSKSSLRATSRGLSETPGGDAIAALSSWPSCADAGRGVSPRHNPTTSDNSARSPLKCATLTITPAPPANLPRSNEMLDGGGGCQPDPVNASSHHRQISLFCHVRRSQDLADILPSSC